MATDSVIYFPKQQKTAQKAKKKLKAKCKGTHSCADTRASLANTTEEIASSAMRAASVYPTAKSKQVTLVTEKKPKGTVLELIRNGFQFPGLPIPLPPLPRPKPEPEPKPPVSGGVQ